MALRGEGVGRITSDLPLQVTSEVGVAEVEAGYAQTLKVEFESETSDQDNLDLEVDSANLHASADPSNALRSWNVVRASNQLFERAHG